MTAHTVNTSFCPCPRVANIVILLKSQNRTMSPKRFCLFKRGPGRLKKGTKISGHSHFNKFACPYFPFSNIPMYVHCTLYSIYVR